jgi:Na(+)-translocating NADH:ubiquinone oxidoreductase F subunit
VENQIECAKHNGRFDIMDGSVQRPPVCVGLRTYEVKQEGEEVFLNLRPSNDQGAVRTLPFEVVSNQNVATFIKELVLKPLGDERVEFSPGDYMHLEIPAHQTRFSNLEIEEPFRRIWKKEKVFDMFSSNHTKTRRNYSLANIPEDASLLKFNVRLATPPLGQNVKAGVGSSYVFSLKKGDRVHLDGPYGDFHVKETGKEMVYIGGGAGMAPLRSHISHLFETRNTKRIVSYWYGARSLSELYYEDYFRDLEKRNENFQFHVALSEPEESDHWESFTGYIHEVVEEQFLNAREDLGQLEFYLCGPPVMIRACLELLGSKGVSRDAIAYDEF